MPATKIDGPYAIDEESLSWIKYGKEPGDIGLLTNFVAQIDEQFVYHDGPRTNTILRVSGKMLDKNGDEVELKPVTIDATELRSMSWVSQKWGMRPILYPMPSVERDVATIMQIVSEPTTTNIYTHTGWAEIDGRTEYLSMTGGIGPKTMDRAITVQLPAELQLYSLPDPNETAKADVWASLNLLKIGPKGVLWPTFLGTYRAALGPTDFALFVAGRTGTFKSELASLLQSHYGAGMVARKLPGTWGSTSNAIQALGYRAKDALFVVDDYVVVGASYQQRTLSAKVDEVIRAQGNQAGRARLTDTSGHQGTMYPRGLILATGEDVAEGHSIRGRMIISELSPGDIPAKMLTAAQATRASYPKAMASWIRWIAGGTAKQELKELADHYRDLNLGIGHARTPSIIGDLTATADLMAKWCVEMKWLSGKQAVDFVSRAQEALRVAGENQKQYLTTADPVQIFCAIVRQLLQTQKAHLKTKSGGVPADAQLYGWQVLQGQGEAPSYKAAGTCLGWLDFEKDEILFDPNVLGVIKKASEGKLTATDQTFARRLKEAGLLTRTDSQRQRNTVRMTLDGSNRNVLAMKMDDVLNDEVAA
jgi:hypothetical protein